LFLIGFGDEVGKESGDCVGGRSRAQICRPHQRPEIFFERASFQHGRGSGASFLVSSARRFRRFPGDARRTPPPFRRTGVESETLSWDLKVAAGRTRSALAAWYRGPAR